MSRVQFSVSFSSPVLVHVRARAERAGVTVSEYLEALARKDLGLPRAQPRLSERLRRMQVEDQTGEVMARLREVGFDQEEGALRKAILRERARRREG